MQKVEIRSILPWYRVTGYKVFDADGNVEYESKAAESAVKVPFLVKVSISDLNIRKGPGTGIMSECSFARLVYIPLWK